MSIDFDGEWAEPPRPIFGLRFRVGRLEMLTTSYKDGVIQTVWVRVPDEDRPGPDVIEVVE